MEPGQTEDLATLSKLDDKVLLDELRTRYGQDNIYTYVGDILVAFNPYRDLGIYNHERKLKYRNQARGSLPPHIFAVADSAYQAMLGTRGANARNQCILISGESGAGKTESTKLIIQQLVHLSKGNSQLEQQIIQVNPLLEAFGNAQTTMNDNSSRFGRYIQLKFSAGIVVGSKISEYLLEKSRVVKQNEGEENFHIFYYMFGGLSPEDLNKYGLKDPKQCKYFSDPANSFRKAGLKDDFDDVVNAMDWVGFTDEEQQDMFTILAAILHIGNVSIDANDINEAVISTPNSGSIKKAADLLGLTVTQVHDVLTCSITFTRGEEIRRNYSKEQSVDSRDAVAKALYGRLFSWIINKINTLLAPEDTGRKLQEIGILDIFGFEHFQHNSFEQACINLANEQLQFFFNKHVFQLEQEEYKREGIDWKEIKYMDNQPLLDLFLAKPIGIIALLDEESQFPKGSDQSFVEKLVMKFDHDPHFIKSPHARSCSFTVAHYAGKVSYDADGWLEKNRDTMPPGVMQMLQVAENALLSLIFRGKISRTGTLALKASGKKRSTKRVAQRAAKEAKERKLTVGAQFKNSLGVLMDRMLQSQPVFVRCIKPNLKKAPKLFEDNHVNAQLLYTGMLETTKIRREGFAVRPTFAEFVKKYGILARCRVVEPTPAGCQIILANSKVQGWQMGKTKVFLKYHHTDILVEQLELIGKKVVHMQRIVRGFLARRRVSKLQAIATHERVTMEKLLQDVQNINLQITDAQKKLATIDTTIPPAFFENNKPNTGSIRSTTSYLAPVGKPKPPTISEGTGTDDLASSSDSDEDTFVKTSGAPFGQAGTRQASQKWFTQTQIQLVTTEQGFAEWFHGIITRQDSEKLLDRKPVGCFLIRVSESRFGYTLSFRAEQRCRHYMINQLPNGKFIVVGEPKVHRSLHDMVDYYKKNKLSNWPQMLSSPCGQIEGQFDYADLIDDERLYFQISGGTIPSRPESASISSVVPPPLPDRHYSLAKPPPPPPTGRPTTSTYSTHINENVLAPQGKKRISTTRARPRFQEK